MKDIRELFLVYGIQMPRRFSRREKDLYINQASHEFKDAGYSAHALAGKVQRVCTIDLVAGDLKNADTIIIANYDTPTHNFGNPFVYYPLNGPSSVKASVLPYYTPFLISIIIAVFVMYTYGGKIDFTNAFGVSMVILLLLIVCFALGVILSVAVGNKVNMDRNTSGVVAAMRIASLLDEAKDHTAFVLTDYGCTRHTGEEVVRREIPDTIDHKQVIYFDCVGNGDQTVVACRKGHEREAHELANAIGDTEVEVLDESSVKYLNYSYYPNGFLVTRGTWNKDSHTVSIPDTATKKDINVDPDTVETMCQNIASYLNKQAKKKG